jgi:hypothetical protein
MKMEFKKPWDVETGSNFKPGTLPDPQDGFERERARRPGGNE